MERFFPYTDLNIPFGPITWLNGNKVEGGSGHATFDKYIIAPTHGNVWGGGQHSGCIRAYNDTVNCGMHFPPGHFVDYDLQQFRKFQLPQYIEKYIREYCKADNRAWLYCWFHYGSYKRSNMGWKTRTTERVVHGFTLSAYDHRLLTSWTTGPTYKSGQVVEWCTRCVTIPASMSDEELAERNRRKWRAWHISQGDLNPDTEELAVSFTGTDGRSKRILCTPGGKPFFDVRRGLPVLDEDYELAAQEAKRVLERLHL